MYLFRHVFLSLSLVTIAIRAVAGNDTLNVPLEQAEQMFVDHSLSVMAARYDIDVAKAQHYSGKGMVQSKHQL